MQRDYMVTTEINSYFAVLTPKQMAGVSVFRLIGELVHKFDEKYGVLYTESMIERLLLKDFSGDIIDEVLYLCQSHNVRIITAHGGTAGTIAIERYLSQFGFIKKDSVKPTLTSYEQVFADCEKYLSICMTREQVDCVLRLLNGERPCQLEVIRRFLVPQNVVILGGTNRGKSTLFNLVAGENHAFVHETAGTTREVVVTGVNLNGRYILLHDTAGFGVSESDLLGKRSEMKTREQLALADVVWVVLDGSQELTHIDEEISKLTIDIPKIVFINKSDQEQRINVQQVIKLFQSEPVFISALIKSDFDKVSIAMDALLCRPTFEMQ